MRLAPGRPRSAPVAKAARPPSSGDEEESDPEVDREDRAADREYVQNPACRFDLQHRPGGGDRRPAPTPDRVSSGW